MPHFRVDDALHSHPKAQRAGDEALGMWSRAGSFCMAYLTDGFVPDWWVKQQPKGVAKAKRLVDAGLWIAGVVRGDEKGWQFHEFTGAGRQDSRAQIEAERERWREKKAAQRRDSTLASRGESPGDNTDGPHDGDAVFERKTGNTKGTTIAVHSAVHSQKPDSSRAGQASGRNVSASGYARPSPGDTRGESPEASLRVTRDPTQPNVKEELSGYVSESATEPNAHGIAATPGAELVRELIPNEHPAAVRTALRIRASELIRAGTPRSDVAAALELWLTKPSLGPNALPSLVSEAVKSRNPANGKPHKVRAFLDLAAEVRADEQAQLESANRKAIE